MLSLMGTAIHDARKDRGLTLGCLAKISGMHLNSLWNFEKGLVVPGICTYFRLLHALEIVNGGKAVFHNR
jgi:transcriptional regulator with XRE-family HTH domain